MSFKLTIMPPAAKHLALARQWQMLNLIPTRVPGITGRELTGRLKEGGQATGYFSDSAHDFQRGHFVEGHQAILGMGGLDAPRLEGKFGKVH